MRFVAGFGKTNIDLLYGGRMCIPKEGEEIYSEHFMVELGGGTPATLINLSRLGVPVKIHTLLGTDLFSRFALEQFDIFQVKPDNLYRGTKMPVNVTTAVITEVDRAFISYTDQDDIPDLYLESVLNASRGAAVILMHEEFLPIYPELKANGAILVYDTGWRKDMNLHDMKKIFSLADWYTPNDQEAMLVTDTSTPGEAARVLADYFEHVVIKLGNRGCLLRSGNEEFIVRPVPVSQVADTTGAGDAFLAGFVYGLYHHKTPRQCALYGNITGAACIEAMGCLTSYVSEQELLQRAQQYGYFIDPR